MAKAQGFDASARCADRSQLADALAAGIAAVEAGRTYLIDVRIKPDYEGIRAKAAPMPPVTDATGPHDAFQTRLRSQQD